MVKSGVITAIGVEPATSPELNNYHDHKPFHRTVMISGFISSPALDYFL
jgi:hypothetical protein